MERRHFLRLAFGITAGATVLAASAMAVPLPPISAEQHLAPPPGDARARARHAGRCRSSQARTGALGPSLASALAPASLGLAPLASPSLGMAPPLAPSPLVRRAAITGRPFCLRQFLLA